MEVVNKRSALLSNYEVLTLLRELESDHLSKTRTALRIKKEEEAAGVPPSRSHVPQEEVLENLRTIEVEAIQYLSAEYQPTSRQNDESITRLTTNLRAYDLTIGEKLQIVNLAPTEAVELYTIVEELEDRFGDRMQDILDTVRNSLVDTAAPSTAQQNIAPENLIVYDAGADYQDYNENADDWQYGDANQIEFDDNGEGAGVEGDFDVDDE
ncbi:hypothetical protein K474DRAFT_1644478 [Panus rudis PR-1116 ss-1]|nr:hypothetical protein K474DRAFT_1644478 [Panus rudis PR-1116 ss-1]